MTEIRHQEAVRSAQERNRAEAGRVDVAPAVPGQRVQPPRSELITLSIIITVFFVFGLVVVVLGHPLGHDEAVYAQRSLYYATGSPTIGYWNDYRAVGLPLLLAPVAAVSATDAALRVVPLLVACGGLALVWWWGRTLFGRRVGLLAAAVLAVTPGYARFASRIYVDVPSAVLGLAAACVLLAAVRGERVRPLALAVIPLSVAATLARYGAPAILAPALAGVALYRWSAVRRSIPLIATIGVLSAGLSAAILLVPAVTGAARPPLGAFGARQVAKELPVWSSAADHVRLAPNVFGPVLVVLVPLCLVVLLVQVLRKRMHAGPVLLNLGIALGFFVMLNLSLAQGAAGYVLPMLPFVATLVAAVMAPALDRRVGVATLSILLAFAAGFALWDSAWGAIRDDRGLGRLVQGSQEVRTAAGGDCLLLTGSSPQVGWYSRCSSWSYPRASYREPYTEDILEDISTRFQQRAKDVPPDTMVYAVLTGGGKREPTGPVMDEVRAAASGPPLVEIGAQGDGIRQHVEVLPLGTTDELATLAADAAP